MRWMELLFYVLVLDSRHFWTNDLNQLNEVKGRWYKALYYDITWCILYDNIHLFSETMLLLGVLFCFVNTWIWSNWHVMLLRLILGPSFNASLENIWHTPLGGNFLEILSALLPPWLSSSHTWERRTGF